MNIEKNNESNETLRDLIKLKREIEQGDKPGVINYIGENKDKKFKIYKYKATTKETKGGIKNKFIKQIGPWIEGTKFIDRNGNEFKKDKLLRNNIFKSS